MSENWLDARPGFIESRVAVERSLTKFAQRDLIVDRSKDMTPAREQGKRNKTCTAFALAGLFEHEHKRLAKETIELAAPWIHVCVSGRPETQFFDLAVLAETLNAQPRTIPDVARAGSGPNYVCGISGQYHAPKLSELNGGSAIKDHLAFHGPVAVTIHVGDDFFEPWPDKKIYTAAAQPPQTHAVCLAGYNDTEGYWRVKNSFGPSWSDCEGFVDIAYGHCSVTKYVAWGVRRANVSGGGILS